MTRTSRLVPAWPLLFIVGCSAGPCAPTVPEGFDRLHADLQDDAGVTIDVRWPDPRTPVHHDVRLTLSEAGATAEAAAGRVSTDGATVRVGDGDLAMPLPDAADEAAELVDELRCGLAGSRWWGPVDPPALGPVTLSPNATWSSLTLPFDWTDGETIHLAVDPNDGALVHIVIDTLDPPLVARARPLRGGPLELELSSGARLSLPVTAYQSGSAR